MEIREVTDKVKRTVKKNPLLIAGAVGGVALFFILSKKGSTQIEEEESEGLVAYNGAYASYPDAATNAETIIHSMNENLNFAMETLREDFTSQLGAFDDRLADMDEKRLEDREYVKESIESAKELFQQNNEELLESINNNSGTLSGSNSSVSTYTPTQYVTNNNTYITATDTAKPSASTTNMDIGSISSTIREERAAKQTGDRDAFFAAMTGASQSVQQSRADGQRSATQIQGAQQKTPVLKDATPSYGSFTHVLRQVKH